MSAEAFASNWAYLKVELNNLERLLLAAVARQKKDQREADRLLRTPADRAAKYWLQGLMNLEGAIGYDSPPPQRATKSLSYGQQLEQRVQATQKQGKLLALPALCERLALTVYEKNLLLLGIAPEIHRRYAKLYEYLNGNSSHLLTVDLSLRLLCRTDQEWRLARTRLQSDAPLRQYQLVEVLVNDDRPFLQHSMRLNSQLVNYLLADQTTPVALDNLLLGPDGELEQLLNSPTVTPEIASEMGEPSALQPAVEALASSLSDGVRAALPQVTDRSVPLENPPLWTERSTPLNCFTSGEFASHLVLPDGLKMSLLQLAQELKWGQQIDQDWGFGSWQTPIDAGRFVMLAGPTGTGKTSAASAIAQYANHPLCQIDLIDNLDLVVLCQQLKAQPVHVLLVRQADRWLGHQADVDARQLQTFFQLRQQAGCLTLFSMGQVRAIPQQWRHWISQKLQFKRPNAAERAAIWQIVFPPQVTVDAAIDWSKIARHQLTGAEILKIARTAALYALAEQNNGQSAQRAESQIAAELLIQARHIEVALSQRVRRRP